MVEQRSASDDVDGGTRDWRNPWRQALRRLTSSARDLAYLQAAQRSSPIPPRCRDGPQVGLCFGRALRAGEGTPLEHPRKIARSTWMREAGVPVGPLAHVAHFGEHEALDLAVRLKKRLRAWKSLRATPGIASKLPLESYGNPWRVPGCSATRPALPAGETWTWKDLQHPRV
jgi:hypothetical protein